MGSMKYLPVGPEFRRWEALALLYNHVRFTIVIPTM